MPAADLLWQGTAEELNRELVRRACSLCVGLGRDSEHHRILAAEVRCRAPWLAEGSQLAVTCLMLLLLHQLAGSSPVSCSSCV